MSWARAGSIGVLIASALTSGSALGSTARYALVVGNNAAPADDTTLAPLSFADDDAARYLELFRRATEKTWLLSVLDDDTQRRYPRAAQQALPPTRANLMRAVDELTLRLAEDRRAGRESVVFFAFSGHGRFSADTEPELVLLDGGLSRRALFDQVLARLDTTRVHLLIDACNAGAMVAGRGPFDRAVSAQTSTLTSADLSRILGTTTLDRFPNVGAVIAASAGQETHEWSHVESGVFTHELISGLLGAADVNGDLVIEYSEIEAFVSAANSRIGDPRARPAIRAIPPALDRRTPLFSLAWVPKGPRLVGSARGLGRFFLERANGQRYADAHLDAELRFALLLPPDEPIFVRGDGFELEVPAHSSGNVALDALSRRPIALTARGSLDTTFRQSLFAAPYGPTYYLGFTDSREGVPVPLADPRWALEASEGGWDQRSTAVTLWIGGGLALVGGVISAIATVNTKHAYDESRLELEAQSLASRYHLLQVVTIGTLGAAALAGGLGSWLWISAGAPSGSAPAGETPAMALGWAGSF